ncbi:MAG: FHA domain-containing protein, partial [Acidimicrobiia bacterium]
TNGTYVNDARVDQATLKAGDEVLVGRFRFVVAHGDDR